MTIWEQPDLSQDELNRRLDAVYSGLPPDKVAIVRVMTKMFSLSMEAYQLENSPMRNSDPSKVLQLCGVLSQQYMAGWDYLKSVWDLPDDEMIHRIDETSDWLKARGWQCLPVYESSSGYIVTETASGMHHDNLQRKQRFADFLDAIRKAKDEKARK